MFFTKSLVESGEFDGAQIIEENKDLSLIMKTFIPEFNVSSFLKNTQEKFNEAFAFYLEGDWKKCKELLLAASSIRPNDGPTKTLMEVMEPTKF